MKGFFKENKTALIIFGSIFVIIIILAFLPKKYWLPAIIISPIPPIP